MFTTRPITTRTLNWLAAISILLQGLPAVSCGCTASSTCGQTSAPSHTCCCSSEDINKGQCCCSRKEAGSAQSCCGGVSSNQDSTSRDGCNCQCGKTQQNPPATPPTENDQLEKLVTDSLALTSLATVSQPQTVLRQRVVSSDAIAFAALDRCISLCRFSL